MSEQVSGICKWYNEEKGYCFFTVPGETADIFVHAKNLSKSGIGHSLKTGEAVKFTVESGPKGKFATNIVKVSTNGNAAG